MPEPNLQRQQSVLNLLNNFKGIDPLKKLFWSELNYDRVNQSLSRRNWKENVANLLADDPVLFASGANDFHIIYGRLASDKLLMGDERPVVSRLLQEHPYALFVFSNSKQEHFHFLNIKYDDDVQKRRMFRRITVGPNERLRTASERIALLDLADISPDLFGMSPLAVQQRHDEAFDVEPVTKEFFSEYRRIFEEVEEAITGFGRDAERKRLYTQRLFNRLMFIAFIQKKGWLKLSGDADYLPALWKAHIKDNSISDKNFYRDRLKFLFFSGLNTSSEVNTIGINRGGALKNIIGDVPYLNGGLFEEDEDDKNQDLKVPDKALNDVLNGLFAKFNFTVTESTPLDVEVAVDPEMLGKIFEELVTGRHESGSYYTPKPIVSFMCREALKSYLGHVSKENKAALERFIEEHEPDDLRNAEAVLDALRKVKVCDPACGSGAYLLGMLHELLDLRAALFQSRKLDTKSVFDRKLEIIQSNIYGVDLDQFAVNIARLRLWLSLAVDFEGSKPEPLPNLDYKVEVGDSICSANPSGGLELGFRKGLVDEFLKVKSEFLTAHDSHKKELRKKAEGLRNDIASWASKGKRRGFDWAIEFAEVFVNGGGFDVVVANPPYVRQELLGELKPALKEFHPIVFAGTADLLCYFYARGIELLNKGGALAFISSNKWLRADYGAKLRDYLSKECEIHTVTDFGDLPVFRSASAYPMIFTASRKDGMTSPHVLYTRVLSLEAPYPDIATLIHQLGTTFDKTAVTGKRWQLELPRNGMGTKGFVPFGEYVGGRLYRGVLTGFNSAFYIDADKRKELLREHPSSKELIRPLATGKEIRAWSLRAPRKWHIFTPIGVDIKSHPAIFRHLKQYETELKQRYDKGPHWWELRSCDYYGEFKKPKIVYQKFQVKPAFAYDRAGTLVNDAAFIIPSDDFYLLAILNSQPFWSEIERNCTKIQNGYQLMRTYFQRCLIPVATNSDRDRLAQLAEQCIADEGEHSSEVEQEINDRVSKLYGGK